MTKAVKPARPKIRREMSENTAYGIILIPFLALFFLFTVLPVLGAGQDALYSYRTCRRIIFQT